MPSPIASLTNSTPERPTIERERSTPRPSPKGVRDDFPFACGAREANQLASPIGCSAEIALVITPRPRSARQPALGAMFYGRQCAPVSVENHGAVAQPSDL